MLYSNVNRKDTNSDSLSIGEIRFCIQKKRFFDLFVSLVSLPIWLPVLLLCMLLILITSGRPIFYISLRRVSHEIIKVIKFRCMVRNAAEIANRDTVAVGKQRFLNISSDSPLYTPIGRIMERCCFTELPQFFQVIIGQIGLIGNRPLPENVVNSLKQEYRKTEQRFSCKAGMTGPVQLIGRDLVSDGDRLKVEIEYCLLALCKWTIRLDFMILFYTVLIGLGIVEPLSVDQVLKKMRKWSKFNITYSHATPVNNIISVYKAFFLKERRRLSGVDGNWPRGAGIFERRTCLIRRGDDD